MAQPSKGKDGGKPSLRRYNITFRRINETLEGNDPTLDSSTMTHLLDEHLPDFQKIFKYWTPPSQASKAAIESGKVKYRNRDVMVTANQKNFSIQISERLKIDEVQAFILLQNYVRTEVKGTRFTYDVSRLDEVCYHYYDERISLCNCLSTLFRNASNPGFQFGDIVGKVVGQLMKNNFETEVAAQLATLAKETVPTHLSRADQEFWLTQNITEQAALLEVLFLMLYDKLKYSPDRLLAILQSVLKPLAFGYMHNNSPFLNSAGVAAMERLGRMSCLVALAAMHLETFADDAYIMEHGLELLNSPKINGLRQEIRAMCNYGIPSCGPVLLSWAAVLCRAFSVTQSNSADDSEWQNVASAAVSQGAVAYLNTMLTSGFSPDDPSLPGYKSVIRGFLSVIMSAFSLDHLVTEIPALIQLHNRVFSGMPPLCSDFWKRDFQRESQISLLEFAQLNFPAEDPSSLLSMTTALIADADTAGFAFEFLKQRVGIRQTLPISRLSAYADEIPSMQCWVLRQHAFDLVPFMILRAGTRAIVESQDINGNNNVTVIWQLAYSVWHVILSQLDVFIDALRQQTIPTEEMSKLTSQVAVSLHLMATLFDGSRGDFIDPLIEHLAEVSNRSVWSSPLLPRLLLILQGAARLDPVPIPLLTSAMKCLHGIAHTDPVEVWREMQRSNLVAASEVRGRITSTGTVRHLLLNVECQRGEYPITIAFLEMLQTLLDYLQGWKNPSHGSTDPAYPDEFIPFLQYVLSSIFTLYPTWRYTSIVDEWNIGMSCLRIFDRVLSDPVSDSSHNGAIRHFLLRSILNEPGPMQVLLNIVGLGPAELERLRRRAKEGKRVERLVMDAFNVLERVLVLKQTVLQVSKATPLEVMLLTRQHGRDSANLIYVIASYVRYYYSQHVPLVATRILTLLCSVTMDGESRPPSLVGYLGSKAEELRTEFLWKLSDSREVTELRISIIRFLKVALRDQPGLAELFIRDTAQLDAGENRKKLHEDDNTASLVESSDIAANFLNAIIAIVDKSDYISRAPHLITEALEFLSALWRDAPDHHAELERISTLLSTKKKSGIWQSTVYSLDSFDQHLASTKRGKPEHLAALNPSCYTTLSRAHLLNITALEMFHTKKGNEMSPGLQTLFDSIKKDQINWFDRVTTTSYDPAIETELNQVAKELQFDISGLQVLDYFKKYGSNFLYDITAVRQRLSFATPRADQEQLVQVTRLLDLIKKVNTHAATIEAELCAARAWTTFVKVATLRKPTDTASSLKVLIEKMLDRLSKENREALPIYNLDMELTSLLLLLLRRWTATPEFVAANTPRDKQKPEDSARVEMIQSITQVLKNLKVLFWRVIARLDSMEVENGAGSAVTSQKRPSLDPNPIIINVLTCFAYILKTVKDWTPAFRAEVAEVLPAVLSCLETEPLMTSALAVAELICQSTTDDPSSLIVLLNERDTVGHLIQKFAEYTRDRSNPPMVEAILHFFLALSQSNSAMCELLAIAGFVPAVTLETFIADVATAPLYLEGGERNPWHRIWCLILSLVRRMLLDLRNRENFVQQALEFVAAHQSRIETALTLTFDDKRAPEPASVAQPRGLSAQPPPLAHNGSQAAVNKQGALSVAKVEETAAAASLLHALVYFRRRWRVVLDSEYSQDSNSGRLEFCIMALLKDVAEQLMRDISTIVRPVSPQERKWWDQEMKEKAKAAAASAAPATTIATVESPLTSKIEQGVFEITNHCLSFVWHISPRMFSENEDPDTLAPLFFTDQEPQIGLLTSKLASTAVKRLNAMDATKPTATTRLLTNIAETSATIVMAHLTLFISDEKYDERVRRRSRDEFAPLLDSTLGGLKVKSDYVIACQGWLKKMNKTQISQPSTKPSFGFGM